MIREVRVQVNINIIRNCIPINLLSHDNQSMNGGLINTKYLIKINNVLSIDRIEIP